jgi:aminomethyltransferase
MSSLLKRSLLSASQLHRFALHRHQHGSAARTALYELHVRHGGKMVVFADHWLPIQYKAQSIIESHAHVRSQAGLFDVSHMLQSQLKGKHAADLIESLCVADCKQLKAGTGSLSVFTNSNGGIIDDLIVSRVDDTTFYIVSNAGCAHKVRPLLENQVKHFQQQGRDVAVDFLNASHSLIALQGPKAEAALQPLVKFDLKQLYFMQSLQTTVQQVPIRVTRCGYTGEDGFELSVPSTFVGQLVERLLHDSVDSKASAVQLAGLGSRDSLRLESGLCLYGNDIDEHTSPIEAALTWTIAKRRRSPDQATFPGADKILAQLNKQVPVQRKRVGLKAVSNGPPARQGATLIATQEQTESIGQVTSGCPSPVLKQNIAIAYVDSARSKIGSKVLAQIRNRSYEYEVVKMPFVPTNYYTPPKK